MLTVGLLIGFSVGFIVGAQISVFVANRIWSKQMHNLAMYAASLLERIPT